jgi:hypothetical protein
VGDHEKMSIKYGHRKKGRYSRKMHHSMIFLSNRERVTSVSLNVRWKRHASRRLLSANASAYMSISAGSVRDGFAVRTYLSISGVGSGTSEMACRILET